jgi:putative hemolysin
METADLWKLALFLLLLLLSGFFSSSETALISLPRSRMMHLINIGHPGATRLSTILQRPEKFLATVLFGNNLVNTAAAALGTALVLNVIDNETTAVLVSTFGVTALLLVFGETLPKTIGWNRAEQVAFAYTRPLVLVGWILAPGIWVLQGITSLFMKFLRITQSASHVSEEEIRSMIAVGAQSGAVEATEAALLEKVFRFGDRQVREIMTPRPEIIWIEQGTTLQKFLSLYAEHSHTRFPVYEGSMENVIGVLSNKDVVVAMGKGQLRAEDSVTALLRPAYFVPETKTVSSTFTEMRLRGHGLVLTVDEFGGIAGLATLKQLLEVIVGEVGEEGSGPEAGYSIVDEDTFQVDAGLGISEINEKLNLALPEGDYQTVAGFILDQLGYIPEKGETLEHGGLRLTVQSMDGVRIEEVELQKVKNTQKGEANK